MTSSPIDGPEPLRVAIVGAGPAGFYAADALLKAGAAVDVFELLPAPFGLLRYGVAPDHQNIKKAGVAFERTAKHPSFRYFGNVPVGTALSIDELRADYDQVLVAIGASTDRKLGIPGEELAGSVAATSFVGWYNAHPDFVAEHFDLSGQRAVIVGMGNVAMDVTRLLVKSPDALAGTDIARDALSALRQSRVREVVLLGRRGPAQAAFDQGELADIAELEGVEVVVEGAPVEEPNHEHSVGAKRNLEYLATLPRVASGRAERVVRLWFCSAPSALVADDSGQRVGAIEIERTELVRRSDGSVSARGTGQKELLEAGMVVRSIGYQAKPLEGLPFDAKASVIPNFGGRVGRPGEALPGCYVVGWIKRGPVGLLGSNKQDARETVDAMLEDREHALSSRGSRQPFRVLEGLRARGIRPVSYADWLEIDERERARGAETAKIREKFATVAEMLAVLDGA
ncbi:MAG: FAD-dependent oxidoreductase [Myxococcota bacterium]|nr:FAD-dependent oxidoreductase [Myxococcota bacterium]